MDKVNIYLETDSTAQMKKRRRYSYVLETTFRGEIRTVEGFGDIEGTYHKVILCALVKALKRLRKPCILQIYTRDAYAVSKIAELEDMEKQDFRDAKGCEIKNAAEWKEIHNLLKEHKAKALCGKHSYSQWLLEEMEHRNDKQEENI